MSDITVILAAGDFPRTARTRLWFEKAARIVCCDSAADPLVRHGFVPAAVVGDLDSVSRKIRIRYADRIHHEAEQETNDLTKAFRFCRANGWNELVILGATGKREDHTLGNLSLLADYALETPSIRLITDHGVFSVALRSARFPSVPGEQISLFAVDPGTRVTSRGLKYPMDRYLLRMWWQATLNEATGTEFELRFTPGRRLLIYRAYGSLS